MNRSRLLSALILGCLIATMALASIPPQGGSENGFRPWDVVAPSGDRFLGQATVKFKHAFPDVYYPGGAAVALGDAELDRVFAKYGVYYAKNLMPWETAPTEKNPIDLRWVFSIHYQLEASIEEVCNELMKVGCVEYAEPNLAREMDFIPNDPLYTSQWHLTAMHAAQAYDYTPGDSSITISIIDSGVMIAHPDLSPNLWVNPGEDLNGDGVVQPTEVNGVDNDGNGRIDDFYGWDWTSNDNDPTDPYSWNAEGGHGTHVAGCATARTNNAVGVASPGRIARIMANRCQSSQAPNLINSQAAFQAMAYSRNAGANIINNSWGGSSSSQTEQNTITSCWNTGMIIFGSAGNDGVNARRFPADYTNSIAVAALTTGDAKSSFSNYGTWVDIAAPGSNIMATINASPWYGPADGTSMSSPVAAGSAALLWSVMPGATNTEVRTTLYETATNIDGANPSYIGMLGAGRIDLGAAISSRFPDISIAGYVLHDSISGNSDGRAEAGEECAITISLTNSPVRSNCINSRAELISDDPSLVVRSSMVNLGNIISGATVSSSDFRFGVAANAQSHMSSLRLRLSGYNPQDMQFTQEYTIQIMIGYGTTFVVDDDNGGTFENFYSAALDSIHESYDVWHVATQGVPTQAVLGRYPAIFWFTGEDQATALTTAEQDIITWALAQGKKILLSSKNAGEAIGSTTFHQQVLHAQYVSSASQTRGNGIAGNPLSEGANLLFIGSSGAANNQSCNTLTPTNGASTAWTYTSGASAAVAYYANGALQLLYCGFPVEAIHGSASTVGRSVFFRRVLNAMQVSGVEEPRGAVTFPNDYSLSAYPNPFNSTSNITFAIPGNTSVRIAMYDVQGREIGELTRGNFTQGLHSLKLHTEGLSNGVYFLRMETPQRTITHKLMYLK